jgi:hypothetical protein
MHQHGTENSYSKRVDGLIIDGWQIYEILIRKGIIPWQVNPMK